MDPLSDPPLVVTARWNVGRVDKKISEFFDGSCEVSDNDFVAHVREYSNWDLSFSASTREADKSFVVPFVVGTALVGYTARALRYSPMKLSAFFIHNLRWQLPLVNISLFPFAWVSFYIFLLSFSCLQRPPSRCTLPPRF